MVLEVASMAAIYREALGLELTLKMSIRFTCRCIVNISFPIVDRPAIWMHIMDYE
jgi:hypothetical protein